MDSQEPSGLPPGPDAPDQQTMEQIRARRLVKLGSAPQQQPSRSPAEESGHKDTTTSTSSMATTGSPSLATPGSLPDTENRPVAISDSQNQSSESATDSATKLAKMPTTNFDDVVAATAPVSVSATTSIGTNIPSDYSDSNNTRSCNLSSSNVASRKRSCSHIDDPVALARPSQLQRKVNLPAEESMDEWICDTIAHVFRITLDPSVRTDSHGHALRLLPNLMEEVGQTGEALRLTMPLLDHAIMEATTSYNRTRTAIHYLYPCWKRVMRMSEYARTPAKVAILDEIKRLSHANCLFACTMPELFDRTERDVMVPLLLGEIDREGDDIRNERMLFEFVDGAVRKFEEDPEVYPAAFADAMHSISMRLSTANMTDDYKPYLTVMQIYIRFPPLVAAVARHDRFLVKCQPQDIERHTILGPFFHISPLQPAAVVRDFPSPKSMSPDALRAAQDSARVQCSALQQELYTIINAFIRQSAESRGKVLDWFALIINTNHKRRAMRFDPREVSSDGFMLNITTVLDLLAQPFLDNNFAKVDRIDVNYFRRNPRIDVSDETKLSADLAESKTFWEQQLPGESNFISEVFFLTLAAHHYGVESINAQFKNMERDIKWMEKQITIMEAEKPKLTDPRQLVQLEQAIKRHTIALDKTLGVKHATQGILLNDGMQSLSLCFMRHATVWLLRVATQSDYRPFPDAVIHLPLSEPVPKEFACLPEFVLQSVVDNFKFIFRFMPQILVQATGEELITLCIAVLHSSNHVRNPYLKSSLVTILYWGTLGFTNRKGVLVDQLMEMKIANKYLLHSLMKFYIECESTGAHTQFYDKFNIRFEIFQVIKVVWVNDVYKQQLTRESEQNKAFFVRFVNMLLNDATYVLDEALTKFPKIHDLERQIENLERDADSPEDKSKLEEELQSLQSQATSYMQLANESLEMMKLFTKALVSAFTMPEIVGRLASMMNYNLETLVGPKASQLKVTNMEKYKFRPIILVSDFVSIYLNLGASSFEEPMKLFIDAVAADGRCFSPENFERAGNRLSSRNLFDPDDLERWRLLQARFKQAKADMDQAELDLGDIPSEFEDPIMGDLMRDPVVLPSKHIVDRYTIVQHLLSDPKDPFTRQPMTIDDVMPATELKEQIEAWRRERIAASAKPTPSVSDMDTAE